MRLCVSLLLLSSTLLGQNTLSSPYPAAVPTDNDLLVASDNAISTLAATISATDLYLPLATPGNFVAPSVVTVGSELIKICSVSKTMLGVCPGGRGFKSSPDSLLVASHHLKGESIQGNNLSYYHNVLSKTVQAIANTLGADLSNVKALVQSSGTSSPLNFNTGSTGLVYVTGTRTARVASALDITGLFSGGSCVGYLYSDGTCSKPDSGSGTVTVAGGDSLSSDHLVTGAGSQTAKTTPVVVDGVGNIITPGALSATNGVNSMAAGNGTIALSGSTSGTFTQTVLPEAGNWTLTMPTGPAAAHQWLTTSTSGVASFTQPAYSDLAGSLPTPGSASPGGVLTTACSAGFAVDYYQSNGAPHCVAISASVGYDPFDTTSKSVIENFCPGSSTNNQIGALGWSSTGTVSFSNASSEPNHPCSMVVATSGSVNGESHLALSGSGVAQRVLPAGPLSTATNWLFLFIFKTPASLTEAHVRVGITFNTTSDSDLQFAGVRYGNSTGCTANLTDTTWMFASGDASAITLVAGPSIATSTWYAFKMRNSGTAGHVLVSMSSAGGAWSTESDISTNVFASAMVPQFQVVNCNTTAKSLGIEYFAFRQTGLTR